MDVIEQKRRTLDSKVHALPARARARVRRILAKAMIERNTCTLVTTQLSLAIKDPPTALEIYEYFSDLMVNILLQGATEVQAP
jgi:hypothetical protein